MAAKTNQPTCTFLDWNLCYRPTLTDWVFFSSTSLSHTPSCRKQKVRIRSRRKREGGPLEGRTLSIRRIWNQSPDIFSRRAKAWKSGLNLHLPLWMRWNLAYADLRWKTLFARWESVEMAILIRRAAAWSELKLLFISSSAFRVRSPYMSLEKTELNLVNVEHFLSGRHYTHACHFPDEWILILLH